ncbi:hypothetical protein ACLBOM_33055 [Escherichia coli]
MPLAQTAKTLASVSPTAPGRARKKFHIDTENAAGTVTWTASSPAVSINGNIMTVKSNPAGVALTGTDADGQTVTLNMGSNWFAQSAIKYKWLSSDYEGTAIHSCRQLGAQVASSSVLQGIISEWGELETYEGWTNLKNNWLYSSTTVISGNGVKSTIAYYFLVAGKGGSPVSVVITPAANQPHITDRIISRYR